jgi:hypothetical protein
MDRQKHDDENPDEDQRMLRFLFNGPVEPFNQVFHP